MPTRQASARQLLEAGDGRPWLIALVAARLLATAIAIGLLALAPSAAGTPLLAGYGIVSAAAIWFLPAVRRAPAAWVIDSAIVLACVMISEDWRSPFYLLWLTTLALPAVHLSVRQAAWVALAAATSYLLIAVFGGPAPGYLRPLTSETLVIHLTLPVVVVAGLAYAADVLRRLQRERTQRERLAIEAERQRIAWELHDSAKQRLHAAHLLVSSLQHRVPDEIEATVQRASIELESAAVDMDTSLAELRSPLEGRPLRAALQERVDELAIEGGPAITVTGGAPALPPLVVAHVYRIGCEALTNALRHAEASTIELRLERHTSTFRLAITDDGRGMPNGPRALATGIRAMQSRAASIGAQLTMNDRPGGGTQVVVDVPDQPSQGAVP